MNSTPFVIRVYGIYIDPLKGILVSDERIQGRNITKFPGGGLEFGEGTIECLKREMMEETGNEFEIIRHYYTTDYFVESAFDPSNQVISIYYMIRPAGIFNVPLAEKPFQFGDNAGENQSFRFIQLNEIGPDDFTLTIDRHVASLLSDDYK